MTTNEQQKPQNRFDNTMSRDDLTVGGSRVAWDRPETDSCQRGTPGCCVDHDGNTECETW